MRIAVIYGSVRRERQGIRAAKFLIQQLESRGHTVDFVDVKAYPLPLLDLRYSEYEAGEAPEPMQQVAQMLDAADAYLVVSGEYNHAIPPALKNLLDHFLPQFRRKAVAIATYSAGSFGGVRVVPILRAVFSNFSAVTVPSTMPIPSVSKAFDENGMALDDAYLARAGKFLDELEWLSDALTTARNTAK